MALNTLQGYNSNSPRRTGLQRVFVRPKHLYTRHPLSPPRVVPSLHVGGSHVSRSAAPSVPKQPRILLRSRRAFSDISPVPLLAPDAMSPAGAQCFWPLEPSSPKCSHLCLRHRRPAPPRRTIPAQQNSCDMRGISVSVKPIMRRSLRVTETARELKSSAWPDVGEASEGHLPQQ
jgi:hypothetical protein